MSKKKGKPMSEEIKVGDPIPVVANEFAPNVIPGAGLVAPAKAPEPVKEEASPEAEFLSYVRGDLSQIARELGYEIVLRKLEAVVSTGPIMLYDKNTREGKVFASREEAPADFITMDELRELIAAEAE